VWDEYALGRWLLRHGDLEGAAAALEKVVTEQPAAFWPHLCQGVCAARRGRHEEAARAFCVCIGSMPENSECYRLRAESYEALGRHDLALRDYDRARQLRK
jgi:Flp pilus assembly protein TadD